MRKILFYAAMAFTATGGLLSCNNDEKPDIPGGGDTTPLATPAPTVSITTKTSVTIEWEAVEHAVSYLCTINGQDTTATDRTDFTFMNLEPGTYIFGVCAIAQTGSQYGDSEWGSLTYEFVPYEPVEVPAEYEPFMGEWTMTSSKTLKCTWNSDLSDYDMTLNDTPMTFDVTIAYDADEECAKITGMSRVVEEYGFEVDEVEAFAQVRSDGTFGLVGGWELPSRLNSSFMLSEYKATWCGFYDNNGEIIPLYNGGDLYYAYTLTPNQDCTEMSGEGVSYTVNGNPTQICAFDVAGISPTENGSYYYYPYDQTANSGSPAGTITFTKK